MSRVVFFLRASSSSWLDGWLLMGANLGPRPWPGLVLLAAAPSTWLGWLALLLSSPRRRRSRATSAVSAAMVRRSWEGGVSTSSEGRVREQSRLRIDQAKNMSRRCHAIKESNTLEPDTDPPEVF